MKKKWNTSQLGEKEEIEMHDIFYFTDVHGNYELYRRVINYCKIRDPEATIIFGGDAADRGTHGYQIIKELITNPQVVYIKGNHEELFINSAREIIGYCSQSDELYTFLHDIHTIEEAEDLIIEVKDTYRNAVLLHVYNGGQPTLVDWLLNGAPEDLIDAIEDLPITYKYDNKDFCHAGGGPNAFNDVYNFEYYNKGIPPYNSMRVCLWDRDCNRLGWFPDRICIHGHTPTSHLKIKHNPIFKIENCRPLAWIGDSSPKKYNGWKIDMDCCTYYSDKLFVLNVLTMEVTGFHKTNEGIEIIPSYKIID